MPRLDIASDLLHAQIDSDLGAGITDLSILSPSGEWTPLLRRAPAWATDPEALGCFLMMPWTNRVDRATFNWEGLTHTLRPNCPDGSAIHGEVRTRPWQIRHRTPQSAILAFDSMTHSELRFPWSYRSQVRYEVSPNTFEVELRVTNTSDRAAPFGLGLHPYFMRRLWADTDAVELRLPATGQYPLKNCIPTGPPQPNANTGQRTRGAPLGQTVRDDLYVVDRFEANIYWPASGVHATFTASSEADHAVIYTPRVQPDHPSSASWFCVEPMTMATDALNQVESKSPGAKASILEPGATQTLQATISVTHNSSHSAHLTGTAQ